MKTCFECGRPAEHDHHVVPQSLGGTKTVPLCGRCHGKVHDLDLVRARALTRRALRERRARGEPVGHAPFGYRVEDGGLVEDAREQGVIREVLRLRAEGLSFRAIVSCGLLNRTGRRLSLRRVWEIVRDAEVPVVVRALS